MPITWRNVSPTVSSGNAVALMNSGTQAVQQGLNTLQNLAAQQQKQQAINYELQKQQNTDDFNDAVAATSLTDLQDPTKVAQLQSLRQSYGQQIDRSGTRNSVTNQLMTDQKQQMTDQSYKDQVAEVNQRGAVDQATELALAGNYKGAQQAIQDGVTLNKGDIEMKVNSILKSNTQAAYAAEDQAMQRAANLRAIAADGRSQQMFQMQKEEHAANVLQRAQDRALKQNNLALTAGLTQVKQQADALDKQSPVGKTSTDPATDASNMMKSLTDVSSPWIGRNQSDIDATQKTLQDAFTNGVNIPDGKGGTINLPVTPAMAQMYANAHKDDVPVFSGPGCRDGDLQKYFTDFYAKNTDMILKMQAQQAQKAQLNATAQVLNQKYREINGTGLNLDFSSLSSPRNGQMDPTDNNMPTGDLLNKYGVTDGQVKKTFPGAADIEPSLPMSELLKRIQSAKDFNAAQRAK